MSKVQKNNPIPNYTYHLVELRSFKKRHIQTVKRFLHSKTPQLKFEFAAGRDLMINDRVVVDGVVIDDPLIFGAYCFLRSRKGVDVTESLQLAKSALRHYVQFVMINKTFARLSDGEVLRLHRIRELINKARPTRQPTPLDGEEVKITRGRFVGFTGFVESSKLPNNRGAAWVRLGSRLVSVPVKFLTSYGVELE